MAALAYVGDNLPENEAAFKRFAPLSDELLAITLRPNLGKMFAMHMNNQRCAWYYLVDPVSHEMLDFQLLSRSQLRKRMTSVRMFMKQFFAYPMDGSTLVIWVDLKGTGEFFIGTRSTGPVNLKDPATYEHAYNLCRKIEK